VYLIIIIIHSGIAAAMFYRIIYIYTSDMEIITRTHTIMPTCNISDSAEKVKHN